MWVLCLEKEGRMLVHRWQSPPYAPFLKYIPALFLLISFRHQLMIFSSDRGGFSSITLLLPSHLFLGRLGVLLAESNRKHDLPWLKQQGIYFFICFIKSNIKVGFY